MFKVGCHTKEVCYIFSCAGSGSTTRVMNFLVDALGNAIGNIVLCEGIKVSVGLFLAS